MKTDMSTHTCRCLTDDDRGSQLTRLAEHLSSHGHTPGEVRDVVEVANRFRCAPPLTDDEVGEIVDSVAQAR